MIADLDSEPLEPLTECGSAGLAVVMRNHHGAHHEPDVLELCTEPQDILVVCNPEIAAHLVLLDVKRTDHLHDFRTVAQLHEHPQLAVRQKAREHTRRMIVVEQLPAELHVEFVAELCDTFLDLFRLNPEIFLVVKALFHRFSVLRSAKLEFRPCSCK